MSTDFKWGELVVDCMKALRESGKCQVRFVDYEVIPPFDGSPEGMFAWFICETRALKNQFREHALLEATRHLRGLLVDAGFPEACAGRLATDVTSQEDIEGSGGRFAYFR